MCHQLGGRQVNGSDWLLPTPQKYDESNINKNGKSISSGILEKCIPLKDDDVYRKKEENVDKSKSARLSLRLWQSLRKNKTQNVGFFKYFFNFPFRYVISQRHNSFLLFISF